MVVSARELQPLSRRGSGTDAQVWRLALIDTRGHATSFSYDAAGRQVAVIDPLGHAGTSAYDANRLQTAEDGAGTTTYTFDEDGNQRTVETPSGDVTTYTWSFENRNTAVEFPTGEVVTFAFDGDEQRVEREDEFETLRFLWDEQNILQETDEAGQVQAEYTLQPQEHGQLVSQRRDEESAFYHFDALGSTESLSDGSEVAGDTYVYQAFGEVEATSGTTVNPFQYVGEAGYWRDEELGLYHVRARDLDPASGRWTAKDPIGFEGGDANLYRYVGNNSVTRHDPSGAQAKSDLIRDVITSQGVPSVLDARMLARQIEEVKARQKAIVSAFRVLGETFQTFREVAGRRLPFALEQFDDLLFEFEHLQVRTPLHIAVKNYNIAFENVRIAHDDYLRSRLALVRLETKVIQSHPIGVPTWLEPLLQESTGFGWPEKSPVSPDPELLKKLIGALEDKSRALRRQQKHATSLETGLKRTEQTIEVGQFLAVGGQVGILLKKGAVKELGVFLGTLAVTEIVADTVLDPLLEKLAKEFGLDEDSLRLGVFAFQIILSIRAARKTRHERQKAAELRDDPFAPQQSAKRPPEGVATRSSVFSDTRVSWRATRPRGTGQTYESVQRTDINWQRVRRTATGDQRAIGLTNEEAARRFGLAPELNDGNFATLHHLGQDARGPLVEASTRYHGVGKPGQDILHSQFGRSQPHPTRPVDRRAFGVDTREYWRWRGNNQ